ncbi:MAG: ribonuclease HII [Saprospiraceae bacterium]
MLKSRYQEELLECGCDEAGRGCLAGPVFAAAVILPFDFYHPELNDSKKLSENKRYELRQIIEKYALTYAVASVTPKKIDQINILNASFLAMTKAIKKLSTPPELILVDGNRFKSRIKTPHHCIIKGDSKFLSIAAASILAKTYRDDYMKRQDIKFPQYNWRQNKGYPTIEHRTAIDSHGTTPLHRHTFRMQINDVKNKYKVPDFRK